MGRSFLLIVAAITLPGLTGCGTARYVTRQAEGGVVAIPRNSTAWPTQYRQEAEALIRSHVGPDYEIVDEREVVTGSNTWNNQQMQLQQTSATRDPGMVGVSGAASGMSVTRDVKEWHITYRRRAGQTTSRDTPAGGPTVRTEYVSPRGPLPPAPAPVTPAGFQSRLSTFDAGKDCKT